jgi:hypothetical protein
MVAANKKGVLKLQRALKDKQLIAILPDQYPDVIAFKMLCTLCFNDVLSIIFKTVKPNKARFTQTFT